MYLYMPNQKCYSPRKGARIVAELKYRLNTEVMLQSPQGARIVAVPNVMFFVDLRLQSPQGARIVATIMLKYCRKTFIF